MGIPSFQPTPARMVLCVLVAFVPCIFAYRLLNRFPNIVAARGYRGPLWVALSRVPMFLGLAAFLVMKPWLESHEHDVSGIFAMAIPFLMTAPFLLLTFGLRAAVAFLPTSHLSRAAPAISEKRFPFHWAGYVMLALVVIGPALIYLTLHKWDAALGVIPVFGMLGIYFFWLAARASMPSAEEAAVIDPRPPVLYLRSFDREDRMFAMTPPNPGRYYAFDYVQAIFDPRCATFDEYFSLAARGTLGPMFALGSPFDRFRRLGAPRNYASDDGWRDELAAYARSSRCILAPAEFTPSMKTEFEILRDQALLKKTFIFTPPDFTHGSRWRQFLFWLHLVMSQSQNPRVPFRTAWPELVEGFAGLSLDVCTEEPPPGSVLAFAPSGSLIVWASGLKTAWEYLDAVDSWLDTDSQTRSYFLACSRVDQLEERLEAGIDRLIDEARANPVAVLEAFERLILPEWAAQREQFVGLSTELQPLAAQQQSALQYMDDTSCAWREYSEGVAAGDSAKIEAALARKSRANQLLASFSV